MTTRVPPRAGRLLAAALLGAAALAGCGDSGPKVYPISGAVTYMGKPVKAGTIRFEPRGGKMDPRASPEVRITDGRYEMGRKQGVQGGPYTVYIEAGDGNEKPAPDGTVTAYGSALFPPYYVTEVDLPAEGGTQDFHIPPYKEWKQKR
jgi:hypothetical protein